MEFLIGKGMNYFTNEKLNFLVPERFLAVDTVFMPVKKVNFFIETLRSSSTVELESLILICWIQLDSFIWLLVILLVVVRVWLVSHHRSIASIHPS